MSFIFKKGNITTITLQVIMLLGLIPVWVDSRQPVSSFPVPPIVYVGCHVWGMCWISFVIPYEIQLACMRATFVLLLPVTIWECVVCQTQPRNDLLFSLFMVNGLTLVLLFVTACHIADLIDEK